MKILKFAAGSMLVSSLLILANAAQPAKASPTQTTKFQTHQWTNSQWKNTQGVGSQTHWHNTGVTAVPTGHHLGSIVTATPIQHSSLTGSSKQQWFFGPSAGHTSQNQTVTNYVSQAGSTSVTTVPTTSQMASQQITAVLTNDWTAWTGSAGAKLTITEVGALLANPKITGSQAAVLGMIADQMNSDISSNPNVSPAYTLAQTQAFVMGTSTSWSAVFASSGALAALPYYTMAMSQIASSTTSSGTFSLYGSYQTPQLATIQQGALGDCFYLSAIQSVLNETPQAIASMIKQNANGSFTVSFPSGTKETVSLTASEIAGFSLVPNNGAWLAVLGLAENSVLAGLATSTNAQTRQQYAVTTPQLANPLGIVADGGYPTQTLNLLTGQSYSVLADTSRSQWSNTASVNKLIQQDLAAKDPLGVETTDHALSIIGFNASTQMVTILNPWGISGAYGASTDPGVMNRSMNVQMTNGVFTISTSQMLSDFYSLTVPTALLNSVFPAPAPSGRWNPFFSMAQTGTSNLTGSNVLAPQVIPSTFPLLNSSSIVSSLTASSLVNLNMSISNLPNSANTADSNTVTSNLGNSEQASSNQAKASHGDPNLSNYTLCGQSDGATVEPLAVNDETQTIAFVREIAPTGQQNNFPALNQERAKSAGRSRSATFERSNAAPGVSGQSVYEAGQGTLLVMHDSPVQVNTKRASVQIAAHAAALIIQIGDEIAVSNLCDKRKGDIAVSIDDKTFAVPMGKTILLGAADVASPSAIRLSECLDGQKTSPLGKSTHSSAFMGRASYLWAIKNCPQFRELAHSNKASDHKAAMDLIKAGAAVMTLAQGQ